MTQFVTVEQANGYGVYSYQQLTFFGKRLSGHRRW
ncbi:Uncharacterised protein [Vibrio cholerae]|nr:Uncharacterised protein [Vibrio cholerae]